MSYVFNGTSSVIEIADSPALRSPTTAATVAGWVKWVGASVDWTSVFGKIHGSSAPYNSYAIQQYGADEGQAVFGVNDGGTWRSLNDFSARFENQWVFIAGTADATAVRLRMWSEAGEQVKNLTAAGLGGGIGYSSEPFAIGRGEIAGRFWQGKARAVGVHDAVLSDGQLETWRTTFVPPVTLSGCFLPLDVEAVTDTAQGGTVTVTGATLDGNDNPTPTSSSSQTTSSKIKIGGVWVEEGGGDSVIPSGGTEGELIEKTASGTGWINRGHRVFIGTRPANPRPYDIYIPEP